MQISKKATILAIVSAMTVASIAPASAAKGRNTAAAAGAAAGLLLGGILGSQFRDRDRYEDRGPVYYYPAPAPRAYYPAPYDPAIAYCMRRFKSYDPYSMTYVGYDGRLHYCP